ncbi:G5 domain-containing protein [Actinoplanes sp. URMC 104]|uniref:G5 domain-containing protein n=1 Tax=Actinoplanes sp. URMC 104 TaxID=3423409 RepID=UPI003F19E75B
MSALLIVVGGAVAGIATLTEDGPDAPRIVTAVGDPAGTGTGAVEPDAAASDPGIRTAEPGSQPWTVIPEPPPATAADADSGGGGGAINPRISDKADRTATREPRHPAAAAGGTRTGTATAPRTPYDVTIPAPVRRPVPSAGRPSTAAPSQSRPSVTTRIETETRALPYQTRLVRDPLLPRGFRKVRTAGAPGEQTLRYLVTLVDGRQTDRKLLGTSVTRQPRPRVIVIGTGRDFDHDLDDDQDRYCARDFDLCMSMSRKAPCPDAQPANAVTQAGPVVALDQLGLLDADEVLASSLDLLADPLDADETVADRLDADAPAADKLPKLDCAAGGKP